MHGITGAAGHRSNELNQQLSSCDLPNICSQHGTCETTETGPQCICQDGFRGRRCENCKSSNALLFTLFMPIVYYVTVVSKRCQMYSKQHEQLRTCGADQWCMPDNFYCHFYPCKNSDGWCLPVQGKLTDSRPSRYDNLLNNFQSDP
jgi:hypothetical protein